MDSTQVVEASKVPLIEVGDSPELNCKCHIKGSDTYVNGIFQPFIFYKITKDSKHLIFGGVGVFCVD